MVFCYLLNGSFMIERKKKKCKGCGEMHYIWAKGQCKKCYMLGKKPYIMRKSVAAIVKTKRHKENKDAEYVAMRAKWREIQMVKGSVTCMECGKPLGDEMQPMNMAHVLSKGSYPSFRCDLRNLVPMCMEHHTMMDAQVDGKTRKDMRVYPELKMIEDKLKQEYYEK